MNAWLPNMAGDPPRDRRPSFAQRRQLLNYGLLAGCLLVMATAAVLWVRMVF